MSAACELVHSLDSDSAAKRLRCPPSSRSTSRARRRSRASRPRSWRLRRARAVEIRGLSTMPPLADDPEASRPYFRRLRELAEELGLRELSMGTSQDYRVAAEEGATFVRVGFSVLVGTTNILGGMGLATSGTGRSSTSESPRSTTRRGTTTATSTEEELEHSYPERPSERPAPDAARRRRDEFDDWTDPEPASARRAPDAAAAEPPAAPRREAPRRLARPSRPCRPADGAGTPRPAEELQRRAADRRQVQAGRCP